jgi:hypothetical protein
VCPSHHRDERHQQMINGACGIRFKPAGDEPRLAARFTADQLHWGGRTAAPDEARRRLVSAAPRPLGQHRRLTPHAWRDRQAQVERRKAATVKLASNIWNSLVRGSLTWLEPRQQQRSRPRRPDRGHRRAVATLPTSHSADRSRERRVPIRIPSCGRKVCPDRQGARRLSGCHQRS